MTGPTGAGKSWLACALPQYACRRGYSVIYQRVPRLQEELRIRHGSGAFGKWLVQLAKADVLDLDGWGMAAIDGMTRLDLVEFIDDYSGTLIQDNGLSCCRKWRNGNERSEETQGPRSRLQGEGWA